MSLKSEITEITPKQAIVEAIENKLIAEACQIIGSGKEAFVIWCKDSEGTDVALKSYRIYRSTHRNIINNTPKTSAYDIIEQFARREYWKNLAMYKLGVPTPQPFQYARYSYTMSLIGDKNGPYPVLSAYSKKAISDPHSIIEQSIDILQMMFQGRFVHGDFSEHNLIYDENKVYVIDFLQAQRFALKDSVHSSSPVIKLTEAYLILQKDVQAILSFFRRCFRAKLDFQEVLDYIVGDMKANIKKEFELNQELL